VAEEAGISRALVSYYFPTKAELLAAALGYAESRAISEIQARTPSGTVPERLEQMLLLEIDDSPAVRDNWIIWGELTQAAVFEPSFNALLEDWTRRWIESVASLIREGQTDGSIPLGADPGAAAEKLTALVDGLGPRWLLGHTSEVTAHAVIRASVAQELSFGSAV
jgi:AcrR family transcriptional regulator